MKYPLISLFLIFSTPLHHLHATCSCTKKKTSHKNIYENVARADAHFGGQSCSCRARISENIGYTKNEVEKLAQANLGLGCGNPIELSNIKEGQTILDLGCGAGLDCFLAAEKVGKNGKVVGIDVTPAMITRANQNKEIYGYKNIDFKIGDIEQLPIENNSVDIIISNCVLSLAKNKNRAFQEAFRVLKPGGTMFVSDIVLLKPLSIEHKNDKKLQGTCVLKALLKNNYIQSLINTGFKIDIISEDLNINQVKFNNPSLPISSLKYTAIKP